MGGAKVGIYKDGYEVEDRGYSSPCWIWTGFIAPDGYGRHSSSSRSRCVYAHRYFYIKTKGPILDNLELDHLCRNKSCVNPDHLEAVTKRINQMRYLKAARGKTGYNPRWRRYKDGRTE